MTLNSENLGWTFSLFSDNSAHYFLDWSYSFGLYNIRKCKLSITVSQSAGCIQMFVLLNQQTVNQKPSFSSNAKCAYDNAISTVTSTTQLACLDTAYLVLRFWPHHCLQACTKLSMGKLTDQHKCTNLFTQQQTAAFMHPQWGNRNMK